MPSNLVLPGKRSRKLCLRAALVLIHVFIFPPIHLFSLAAFHYESIETHSFIFCLSHFFLSIMFSSSEWIKE